MRIKTFHEASHWQYGRWGRKINHPLTLTSSYQQASTRSVIRPCASSEWKKLSMAVSRVQNSHRWLEKHNRFVLFIVQVFGETSVNIKTSCSWIQLQGRKALKTAWNRTACSPFFSVQCRGVRVSCEAAVPLFVSLTQSAPVSDSEESVCVVTRCWWRWSCLQALAHSTAMLHS